MTYDTGRRLSRITMVIRRDQIETLPARGRRYQHYGRGQ